MGDPIPMLIWCPWCKERHLDVGAFATKPHHTHACQKCGGVWRPAVEPTVGVEFLPGFKNEPSPDAKEACFGSVMVPRCDVAAYLIDRADQYSTESGYWIGLAEAARKIMNGAVEEAVSHGEFDFELYSRVDGFRQNKKRQT